MAFRDYGQGLGSGEVIRTVRSPEQVNRTSRTTLVSGRCELHLSITLTLPHPRLFVVPVGLLLS